MNIQEPFSKSSSQMVNPLLYNAKNKQIWDNFVSSSKNGVFLFLRDYMEYHSDRFKDHSLMFFKGNTLVALLPANLANNCLCSHAGLTFGGVISGYRINQSLMLEIFKRLLEHCKAEGIAQVVYKPVPYIYHTVPADEDLYALFNCKAQLIARNAASCIYQAEMKKPDKNRMDNIRKAKANNILVKQSSDFEKFMLIEKKILADRHGVKPVHSADEITLLAKRFPENIKLFASYKNGEMLAGLIVYESKNVAHVQYASNSKEGWNVGAQDIIEDYLINDYYKNKKYFDFGISTENSGKLLNFGLIKRKENFGASAVMYDTYLLTT